MLGRGGGDLGGMGRFKETVRNESIFALCLKPRGALCSGVVRRLVTRVNDRLHGT